MNLRPDSDFESDDNLETQFFTCKKCKRRQPLSEYYKTPSGHRHACKTCILAARKIYYVANREAKIAYSTRWNQEHRERHNEIHRERRKRNKDENRERLINWRQANPEKWRAQQDRSNRLEKLRGHPNAQKRRALEFEAFVEHVDKRVVYDMYNGRCGLCGDPVAYEATTLDHILPLSRGGKHSYDNIQPAHGYCNRSKGNKTPEEYEGFKQARDQVA